MTLDLCAAKPGMLPQGNLVNLEECNAEAAVVNGIQSLGLWGREDLEDVSQGNYI